MERRGLAKVEGRQVPLRRLPKAIDVGHPSGPKTAISIPDGVFENAERLARKLHKSRSQLYREALIECVARHSPASVTEALDRLADELGAEDASFRRAAARRVLGRTEW